MIILQIKNKYNHSICHFKFSLIILIFKYLATLFKIIENENITHQNDRLKILMTLIKFFFQPIV